MTKRNQTACLFIFISTVFAWTENKPVELSYRNDNMVTISRHHTGAVLSLSSVPGTDIFYSGDVHGFVTRHDKETGDDTWQVSDLPVRKISVHPSGTKIAIHESDGYSIHRVSVWSWPEKKRLYAKRFKDPVISLSWSAKGSWLLVGNTSLEGITILDENSGYPKSIFSSSPGIVSLSATSSKESNLISFGPGGRIIYTDIANGSQRASYNGPTDLVAPVLLNNSLKIAGILEDSIISVDATTGKTVDTWVSRNPILATHITDEVPVWFEQQTDSRWILRSGHTVSLPLEIPSKSIISIALATEHLIIAGTTDGRLFSFSRTSYELKAPQITELLHESLRPIDDIATHDGKLFILSRGDIYTLDDITTAPIPLFSGIAGNRIAICLNKLVVWSKSESLPVSLVSMDGLERTEIYIPAEGISSVSTSDSFLAIIEGSSKVIVIDINGSKSPYTYKGAGLQDVILLESPFIAVSKSTSIRSPQPMMLINSTTGETVQLPIDGNLAYGFTHNYNSPNIISGFIVSSNETAVTDLVTVEVNPTSPATSHKQTEASYADEDLNAFMVANESSIITNLGKGSISEIDRSGGRQKLFERGYALPIKIVLSDMYIISLNSDGTLTWFSKDRKIGDSWITISNVWVRK